MNKRLRCITIAALTLAGAQLLHADTLVMRNGDRLTGRIVRKEGDVLTFKTDYAGEIRIGWKSVAELETEESVTVVLEDGDVVRNAITSTNRPGMDDLYLVNLSEVDMLNPEPWQLGEGWRFAGRVTLGLTYERGNNIKDETDLEVDLLLRDLEQRLRLQGLLEHDTSQDTTTKRKWSSQLTYDRFIRGKKVYGLAAFAAEADKFADLELRAGGGPGVGYQFYDTEQQKLRAEIPLAYLSERYSSQPDDEFWSSGWRIQFERRLFDAPTRLYFDGSGIWNLEDTDRVITRSLVGLRAPLHGGLTGTLESKHEYDTQPAPGADKEDWTHRFKFGYEW